MAGYIRCQCTGGDIPHHGATRHVTMPRFGGPRTHWRCTRRATVSVRRVVDTSGRPMRDRLWCHYCEPCARAIVKYQGTQVEQAEGVL